MRWFRPNERPLNDSNRCNRAFVSALLLFASARVALAAPEVRIESTGEEPRRAIRFELEADDAIEVRSRLGSARSSESKPRIVVEGFEGVDERVELPTLDVRSVYTVRQVEGDAFRIERAILEASSVAAVPGVNEGDLQLLEEEIRARKDLVYAERIRRDGSTSSRDDFEAERRGLGMGFVRFLDAMRPVFPAEAVGAGAKWSVEDDVELEGMIARTIVRHRIVELGEREIAVESEMEGVAGEREFPADPALPGGRALLRKMLVKGKSVWRIDPELPHPVASEGSMDAEMYIESVLPTPGGGEDLKEITIDVVYRRHMNRKEWRVEPPASEADAAQKDADGAPTLAPGASGTSDPAKAPAPAPR